MKNKLMLISYYESYFYFLVWSCAIVYSVYQFYLANNCKNIGKEEKELTDNVL